MKNIELFFQEAIKAEKLMAGLYLKYSRLFRDDQEFWGKLNLEELKHAEILTQAFNDFKNNKKVPNQLLTTSADKCIENNKSLTNFVDSFEQMTISRREAYQFAIHQEELSIEILFQQIASSWNQYKAYRAFKELVADDKNHASRIHHLMQEKGLLF